ncbi:hypothetical protein [Winogradskyella sp.]|uniref:hypothetical protein n=1 Tax=Winogradskyella sp. TaxID=1883156 RepID=UPI00262A36B8|nr:hypothetical protein [Winogradskyella sp.]
MIKKCFAIIIIFISILNCKNGIKEVKKNEKIDPLLKEESISIKINDTLIIGERNFGKIFTNKILHDTIKRTKMDIRGATAYINLYNDINRVEDEVHLRQSDTFYQSSLNFEKIEIPFFIQPKLSGNYTIVGIIDEQIILDAYKSNDSMDTRVIEFRHYLKKDIYVKSN